MTCKEIVELVTEYLEGALPQSQRRAFEEHLGECDGCAGYLEQMLATIRMTGALTEESLPAQVRDELVAAFRGWSPAAL